MAYFPAQIQQRGNIREQLQELLSIALVDEKQEDGGKSQISNDEDNAQESDDHDNNELIKEDCEMECNDVAEDDANQQIVVDLSENELDSEKEQSAERDQTPLFG